jgi:hypothetical protein
MLAWLPAGVSVSFHETNQPKINVHMEQIIMWT